MKKLASVSNQLGRIFEALGTSVPKEALESKADCVQAFLGYALRWPDMIRSACEKYPRLHKTLNFSALQEYTAFFGLEDIDSTDELREAITRQLCAMASDSTRYGTSAEEAFAAFLRLIYTVSPYTEAIESDDEDQMEVFFDFDEKARLELFWKQFGIEGDVWEALEKIETGGHFFFSVIRSHSAETYSEPSSAVRTLLSSEPIGNGVYLLTIRETVDGESYSVYALSSSAEVNLNKLVTLKSRPLLF